MCLCAKLSSGRVVLRDCKCAQDPMLLTTMLIVQCGVHLPAEYSSSSSSRVRCWRHWGTANVRSPMCGRTCHQIGAVALNIQPNALVPHMTYPPTTHLLVYPALQIYVALPTPNILKSLVDKRVYSSHMIFHTKCRKEDLSSGRMKTDASVQWGLLSKVALHLTGAREQKGHIVGDESNAFLLKTVWNLTELFNTRSQIGTAMVYFPLKTISTGEHWFH